MKGIICSAGLMLLACCSDALAQTPTSPPNLPARPSHRKTRPRCASTITEASQRTATDSEEI